MANNVKYISFLLLLVISIFSVSALTIIDESPDLGNQKFYDAGYGDYGKILVKDVFDVDLAEYILLESDSSIINAHFYMEVNLFQDGKILDGLYFENIIGQEEFVKSQKITLEILNQTTNETINTVLYNYEIYSVGKYYARIDVERSVVNDVMDWIIRAKQKLFIEWYWFNNLWSWSEIFNVENNQGTNLTDTWVNLTITKDGTENNINFSDSRFTNNEENQTELIYTKPIISNDTLTASVMVKIPYIANGQTYQIKHYYSSPSVIVSTGITSNDSAVNFSVTKEAPVKISTIETFQITEDNLDFSSTPFTISCQGISVAGVDKIRLFIDGTQFAEEIVSSNDVTFGFTISSISQGNHNWFCEAEDVNGIKQTSTRNFYVDTLFPTISIIDTIWDTEDKNLPVQVIVENTITDENLDNCSYKINNGEWIGFVCGETIVDNLETYGDHSLTLKATDIYSHSTQLTTETITISDISPPTIMIESPRGTSDLTSLPITLDILVNEDATCSYRINGGNYFIMNKTNLTHISYYTPSARTFSVQFSCEDGFGNIAETEDITHILQLASSSSSSGTTATPVLTEIIVDKTNPLVSGKNLVSVKTFDQFGKPINADTINLVFPELQNYTIGDIFSYTTGVYIVEVFLPETYLDFFSVQAIAGDVQGDISNTEEMSFISGKSITGFSTLGDNFKKFIGETQNIIISIIVLLGLGVLIYFIIRKNRENEYAKPKE